MPRSLRRIGLVEQRFVGRPAHGLFAVRIESEDSDHDGLEDQWELTYFSTLARDGTGDFDSDGLSDGAEYRAATDPTHSGSLLRVLTLSGVRSGATRLIWSAVPGQRYQLQFLDALGNSRWTDIGTPVVATSITGTMSDLGSTTNVAQRFYRVVLQP